ncbi:dual specificity protein phosphatase family protein [Bacillus sp. ISL-55]|uniref:dual specificity protein phosphatase family protein n=1 Tax=Bacillus sp. ISL-55 TaxID=2819134 RepID=UPI001BEAD74A|nr:dual specificity protein phosphatase family protein [Bacillus sp. ISL-55]MBT2694062.1 dual specificity protein phosphatase family protein [Bacillus sp. ISL-55]
MSFTEMIPGRMYVGGRISSRDWPFVYHHITSIVNLRTKPDRPPFDFSQRMMIWAPLTIKVAPSIDWIERLMGQINDLVVNRHRILIHDTFGYQRLGFVIAAYYMQRFQLNRNQALYAVRKKKPDIQPTPNYMEVLTEYERHLGLG